MTLKEQITEDMKAAMRAKEAVRLSTIRMLTAAIKQREVDERIELSDADVLALVDKLIKQRRDALSQFSAAGRQDLADKEQFEIEVLSAYLPKALSSAEIEAEVSAVIKQVAAQGPQDMGKVMAALKPRLAGKADMGQVSTLVKTKLSQ